LTAATPGIALHLIGPLQSNKVKEAVALFDTIHSVDRDSLCDALAKELSRQPRRPELFVQINTGEEPQKAGIAPADADAFIARCRETYGLAITGLIASASKVFDTATNVTSARSRRASRQACAISCSTASSPDGEEGVKEAAGGGIMMRDQLLDSTASFKF
jgi:uncharacterized pyridoxal phosphate-containing UPF0001 family protein